MVGRFNVREGSGDEDWSVWDNAANGSRGAGLSEQAAHRVTADLELQYDVYGPALAGSCPARRPAGAGGEGLAAGRVPGCLDLRTGNLAGAGPGER